MIVADLEPLHARLIARGDDPTELPELLKVLGEGGEYNASRFAYQALQNGEALREVAIFYGIRMRKRECARKGMLA